MNNNLNRDHEELRSLAYIRDIPKSMPKRALDNDWVVNCYILLEHLQLNSLPKKEE